MTRESAGLLIVATMALCASPSDQVVVFLKQGDGTIDPTVYRGLYMTMALVSLVRSFLGRVFGAGKN